MIQLAPAMVTVLVQLVPAKKGGKANCASYKSKNAQKAAAVTAYAMM
jgi:hypothetical protein